MGPTQNESLMQNRRQVLQTGGVGLGAIAFDWLTGRDALAATTGQRSPLAAKRSNHLPRAKHVIYLHMTGGPSTLDLFDEKPVLRKYNGQPLPKRFTDGQRFAFIKPDAKTLATKFSYARHGQSGLTMSGVWKHLPKMADDLTLLRTVYTEQFNHGPSQLFMHTGFARFGRPSLGAWTTYGLGSESDDLPAYVVLNSGGKAAGAGNALWGSGFLPSVYQGVEFRSKGDPVLFLSNPRGISSDDRKRMVGDIAALNGLQLDRLGDPEIATRIRQYELAFEMQTSVPELANLADEPASIHKLYGIDKKSSLFARHCLMARRLVERGVRFVQLFNIGWDHHSGVFGGLERKCAEIDRPIAALLTDLKARGLLDETLVVWGGEFGRTPMGQGSGRDHHKDAFCMWMAGGGSRGGTTVGRTDDFGYHPVETPIHVNDLHATILHLLGMDHTQLTYRVQGRDFRLTDVGGEIIDDAIDA